MFNATSDALTFNEEAVVIALSYVASLMLCALLAAILFGALSHVSISTPQCPEWDETSCGICCAYVGYRFCPRVCCSNWRRHMQESVEHMRTELYEQEMMEMRELEQRETEKQQQWIQDERSGKYK